MSYAELDLRSNFSFLEGASHAEELMAQAASLGMTAIGLADRNTLAGVVRALRAVEKHEGMTLLVGSRLVFRDGTELIVYPRDRAAYGRLCRLLSLGKSRIDGETAPPEGKDRTPKNETRLDFEDAVAFGEGLVGIAPAPEALDDAFSARLSAWAKAWPDTLYLGAHLLHRGDDRARLNRLVEIGARAGMPPVATNAVLYHHFDRRPLQDVLTCVREKTTIEAAGFRLQANAERYLKPPSEMARLFKGHETMLARTQEIVDACGFSLRELSYHYPNEPIPPGRTADQHLRRLSFEGLRKRFPEGPPAKVVRDLIKELRLIRKVGYPHYFLTVHDIVAWAREQAILCQGRGSSANSVVCFCLGITNVNPGEMDLLFERFLSEQRREPPDIDVDFEHDRREEVMQYVYERYGRHRAAIVATVIHYRPRSAIRDVGKALGLTEDVTSRLAGTVWGSWGARVEGEHVDTTGLDRDDRRLSLALTLAAELTGFPRHLSQHVGGYVLTEGPLIEMVPVGNAAMKDRTFIEWDKDDIDELKIMKVDVLALGMLSAIRRGFDLIEAYYGYRPDLAMPPVDKEVYAMLQRAESIGVFQVESRAQMSMLPRLRPEVFYDLVVQVAIVRPGPIQGGMVHPYLRTRAAQREAKAAGRTFRIDFPRPSDLAKKDELEVILKKTFGVPIFQEQAMRIAMSAAEFSGDEANGLRRAMATFRHLGTIHLYEKRFVGRMVERGYDPEFAQSCFDQIKGFGEYGFPESHAAAFAHLVYVSAWMKHYHPDVFCAALLNSQPMGFYAPAQLVRDARNNGVEVLPPDVNRSGWDSRLEATGKPRRALRLGLRQIGGFKEVWAKEIIEENGPFESLEDLRHAGLPARGLELLAAADALGSLDLSRRGGLWTARGLPKAAPAPLFLACGVEEQDGAPPEALPAQSPAEAVVGDYETLRLSLKAHPVSFLREAIRRRGGLTCAEASSGRNGQRVSVCGVVLMRQRPGSAKGVCFVTLEDETGITNLVLWPAVFEQFRPIAMGAKLMTAHGRLQRSPEAEGGVVHLVVHRLEDDTAQLHSLGAGAPSEKPSLHRHPRDVRILPRSRDFH